ncbi:MAG: DNA polymerase/3'-5' exonuclease PolX [bacterium]|nr:DNA polymerase/3'-5' exonuclease PolX [bacterium]
MTNQELAKIFYEIANYLDMEEAAASVPFKSIALKKAAVNLESLNEDAGNIYKKGGLKALMEIPGVGKGIAFKIEEYLKTGKIKELTALKKKTPVDLGELIGVEGLGTKKISILYKVLGIKNLKDLEKAAQARKIAPLFGFGEKTEKNILEGIAFLKRSRGRFLLGEILPKVKEIEAALKNLKETERVEACGSVRRKKETIGDVDFLVASNKPGKIMDFFVSLPGVVKIWGKGATKASVRLKDGFDMDIRVVPRKSYGAALQYFTGSKEHNIVLRKIAINKGYKLSEYGLFKGSKMIAGESEKEIYEKLGLEWIPPEMRENTGEIELALRKKLPKLVELQDIKGDLHYHSNWDGGTESIKEMVEEAVKMGYEYIGVSDHTKFLRIEHGLDEKQLVQQRKEIDKINSKLKTQNSKLRILHGCEANILADGSIDIKDEALAKLDFVIAGVHSQMKMSKEKMTERIIKAMKNPNVDIISHPTGRILKQRDEYEIDFDEILKAAKETGAILEINANPYRLDLNGQNIRRAKEAGVKMIINTDAHHKDHLRFMEYGVSQARRGRAEKIDIVNCWSAEKALKMLK